MLTDNSLSKVTGDETAIDPFYAYFAGNSAASKLDVYVDGEITGIKIIDKVIFLQNKDAAIHDLLGRRVTKPGKGLYIVDGVKVAK